MRNITKAKITLLTAIIFQIRITLERNKAKDMFITVGGLFRYIKQQLLFNMILFSEHFRFISIHL